eukprot:CAMPEP_0197827456 /NCGR_PEP_ID=MMETSP1437-20131217/4216_1 /TAXON_ID=49252 ORGANISM="Eucampia antarctica, Strain CCMP1452" /NCGR_SAMPLE_ID=MMETSP1437 /ASSEMBLY_ACC=CAM_ASM_001096 /LENGTH=618 /DNA_ID=CAMNT_0043428289 /DNA_START=71 /DNA_END=1927 /DNA_ORIENTATION=-
MSLLGSSVAFQVLTKGTIRHGISTTTRQAATVSVARRNNNFVAPLVRQCNHYYSTTSSSSLSMSKDESFPTWTFDKPCSTMEWSELTSASMSITSSSDSLDEADLVIIGVTTPVSENDDDEEDDENAKEKAKEKEKNPPEPILSAKNKELDDTLGGVLGEIMIENYKAFKHGASIGSMTPATRVVIPGSNSKRYVLLGLGKEGKDFEDKDMTKIAEAIASECNNQKKVSNCTILLPKGAESLSELSCAFYNALYADNRYRTGDKQKIMAEDLTTVTIVADDAGADKEEAIATGKKLAMGMSLTKDIVNAPHNVLNSLGLANVAREIAEHSNGTIKCTILDKKECEKRNMGSFLGVARGSETEPQFIHLTYKPKSGEINKKVGIVGKGLLFDTGGYNIKTAGMELMKFDCGGSAAVLGAARAIGELAPEGVEAHFLVAACENMINDRAVVPSDVLTASNGKTIEIINTDAEGRLTLADALVYADKEVGCESIIELSTLTGACMVSLGVQIAGVWTSDDNLAKELDTASKVTGDKTWRMPLAKEYNDQLESKIADLTNCGTRYGGAITAALFLQHFVSDKKPFAHIDIAGPVWSDKIGATGFGAKLVTEWVTRQGDKNDE